MNLAKDINSTAQRLAEALGYEHERILGKIPGMRMRRERHAMEYTMSQVCGISQERISEALQISRIATMKGIKTFTNLLNKEDATALRLFEILNVVALEVLREIQERNATMEAQDIVRKIKAMLNPEPPKPKHKPRAKVTLKPEVAEWHKTKQEFPKNPLQMF